MNLKIKYKKISFKSKRLRYKSISVVILLFILVSPTFYIIFETMKKDDFLSDQNNEMNLNSSNLEVPYFSQLDDRWKYHRMYDLNGVDCGSVGIYGCAMTSTSMVLKYYSKDTDPGLLNAWLNSHKGYASGGLLYWSKPAEYSGGLVTWIDNSQEDTWEFWHDDYQDWLKLKSELDNGYPVIVKVDKHPDTYDLDEHWVVVTGFKGGDIDEPSNYYINDPANVTFNLLSVFYDKTWDNTIFAMRFYHPVQNNDPNIPINLKQLKSDSWTSIPEGGITDESTVVFKGIVSDPDGDNVRLEIELLQIGVPFTGEPTFETISDYVPSGTEVTITRYGLINAGYHWQCRARDSKGDFSNWGEFGISGNIDFIVNVPINNDPNPPSSLQQLKSDSWTSIPEGGITDESTVVFKGIVSDPDGDNVRLEIELLQIGVPFTGEPTFETISDYVPSGTEVTITRYGLINAGYHWQCRARDSKGDFSNWGEFGISGNIDFIVNVPINNDPNPPSSLQQLKSDSWTSIPEGGITDESTVVFKGIVSDPDGDNVRLEIELLQIGVPFTGEPTFETISDYVPSGTEVTITRYGLINAGYHWQCRARDSKGDFSNWGEFGISGNIDFIVNVPINNDPNPPTTAGQYFSDGVTQISEGGTTSEHTVVFKAYISDPDGDDVTLEIELRNINEQFYGVPTSQTISNPYPSGSIASVTRYGLDPNGYKWQYRAKDSKGDISEWKEFGASGNTDFTIIELSAEPIITSSLTIIQSDPYYEGDLITGRYSIKNEGSLQIAFEILTIGGLDPDNQVADFTTRPNVVLDPGEIFAYQGTLTLTKSGNYHFFCAYKNSDGSWNTAIPTLLGVLNTVDIYVNPIFTEPIISQSLEILDVAPHYLGDTITAKFSIINYDIQPITFEILTIGGHDPDNQVADFSWLTGITLNPGKQYEYYGSITLSKPGLYHFFCAYKPQGGNWNTGIPTLQGVTNIEDIWVEVLQGDTLRVGTYGINNLDPHFTWESGSIEVIHQVYEGLYAHDLGDPSLKIIPRLATGHGIWSTNNLEYTVTLRQGITFHDGTVFDAYAVKFSFDRLKYFMTEGGGSSVITPLKGLYSFKGQPIINRVEIVNSYTVKFVLNNPYAAFQGLLCFTGSYILSPTTTPPSSEIDLNTEGIIGTGPFVYDGFLGDRIKFHAFNNYWRGKAKINDIIFYIYDNSYEMSQSLSMHKINFINNPGFSHLGVFYADPHITVMDTMPSTTIYYLGMNNKLINVTYRKAISYAIDYNKIIEEISDNRAVRLKSPIPEGIKYSDYSFDVPELNLVHARQIMQSMGFGIGYRLDNDAEWLEAANNNPFATYKFTYNPGYRQKIFYILQDNLAKIGIEVLEEILDWQTFLDMMYGNRDMLELFWTGWAPDFNDPCNFIDSLFTNKEVAANAGQVDDALVQQWMEEALSETDPIIRESLYKKIQLRLIEEVYPCAWGYVPINYDVYTTDLKGFQSNPMNDMYFYPCYFESTEQQPIHMNSNYQWAASATSYDWCTGSGTLEDPYIIQDLEIDATGYEHGILIENSDVFFRIENCTIFNAGLKWENAGIKFINVEHGVIIDCNISNNLYSGIYLENSIQISIRNNILYKNGKHGIVIDKSSDYNIIYGNIVNDNGNHGIFLLDSNHNEVIENIVTYSETVGICIDIWFGTSDYNLIYNNTADYNNWNGIYLGNSNFCNVSENNLKFNGHGSIHLYSSNLNNITKNNARSNQVGVSLRDSQQNTIDFNVLKLNNHGITLENSDINYIQENYISDSNYYGILLLDLSEGNLILNNLIVQNSYAGILLYDYSGLNTITENTIIENEKGIWIVNSNHNWIYLNNFINNTLNGYSYNSENTWFSPNTINYIYKGETYNNPLGNFWSDYDGFDSNDDGIGDNSYVLEGEIDNIPLMGFYVDGFIITTDIKLQLGGIELSEINVGEFFDIYVGVSTDDFGIEQVRFSSDDVQDGIAIGEWTEWYEWDTTLGDWNAETKIKRWLFGNGGDKEVWVEVIDANGRIARDYKNIYAVEVSLILTGALELSPIKDFYYIGDTLTATFTIKNERDYPIIIDVLTVGGRLNGWCLDEGCPDFTHRFVKIMPYEEYRYEGTITLNHIGNYRFFIAYYIEDPSTNEEFLLDENNWNTCINLGQGLTHGSRVKNLFVVDKEITPDDLSELRNRIQEKLTERMIYPPYLLDPDAYNTAWISTAWYSITSWLRQENLVEKYNEFYHTGINYDQQSLQSLINAKNALNDGFIDLAKIYLNDYYRLQKLSAMSFSSASEFFDNGLQKGQELAYKLLEFCLTTFKIGMYVVNPTIAKYLDFVFIPLQFIFEKDLYGLEEAVIKAGYRAYMKFVFTQIPIENGLSIEDLIKNGVDYNFFPIIANIQNDYITQQQIIQILEAVFTTIPKSKIVDMMYKLGDLLLSMNKKTIQIKSPVELMVYNSEGKVTGLVNGEVKHGISRSIYFKESVIIFYPDDSYLYNLKGTEEGIYGLEINAYENGVHSSFIAENIPISANEIHQYEIDWFDLSQGEEGVKVDIDSDGDGTIDYSFTSDNELNTAEYIVESLTWPYEGDALQDGFVFELETFDNTLINWINVSIREPDGEDGIILSDEFENIPLIYDDQRDIWESINFDTTQLPDGYYVLFVQVCDASEFTNTITFDFSIRNWAILELLPATQSNKPGRTMPVKFTLRVAEAVDPSMPFVVNDELCIIIYDLSDPSVILQESYFGDSSKDYRIDTQGELYITNFKTSKTPAIYVVEIWRNDMLIGNFTFSTMPDQILLLSLTNYTILLPQNAIIMIFLVSISIVVMIPMKKVHKKKQKQYN